MDNYQKEFVEIKFAVSHLAGLRKPAIKVLENLIEGYDGFVV